MKNETQLKTMVRERYDQLAQQPVMPRGCGCKKAAPQYKLFTIMSEDYTRKQGYEPEADLGVGCGLPVEYADLHEGDTVVDLGSGAGNDCFIAREEVGASGRVIGIDFAPKMVERARANAARRGYDNMEFIEGDIEQMPLVDGSVDVVISNCVLNLLPRKDRIFREIFRVLKPDGHFCISDVVLDGHFPPAFVENAAMYAGCIASAIQQDEYLSEVAKAGFEDVRVARRKRVVIPYEVLEEHLSPSLVEQYREGKVGVYSITVVGRRNSNS